VTWLLRRAGVGDLEAIMELETSTFATDAWSSSAMAAELGSPHTLYFVAVREGESDGAIDGYAGLLAPVSAQQADIQTIAVAERARRSGLGRTMMQHLMTEARQRGASEVFLEVRADNPGAQALYTMLGFEIIGVRARYYQPDGVDAIVMRCQLREPTAAFTMGATHEH
jgi:ribosomal-protein-alanine N-acetyltransferase